MSGLTADQAKTILDTVAIPSLQAEHPVTEHVIAAIPADKGDFAPDPVARPAIELAWHIVMAEDRFVSAAVNGAFDLTPRPRPEGVRTGADVNEWYAGRLSETLRRLADVPGERLAQPIDFRGVFNFPAVMYIEFALRHTIHHRGQLSMYLRSMGAKVPSIYGESYDARVAREQAGR